MENDSIVKTICQIENINLSDWSPVTERGEQSDSEFDKRFSLDRTYSWQQKRFRKRIRFVKYRKEGEYITLNISKMKLSNIIQSRLDNGKEVYFKGYSKDIRLRDIERPYKLGQIMKKMGR